MVNDVWHFYRTGPIDFHWEFLPTVEAAISIFKNELSENEWMSDSALLKFIRIHDWVKSTASNLRFYGDYRSLDDENRVMWIPSSDDCAFDYGFVWKQDNDGTCFVASPFEMPWLNDECSEYAVFRMGDPDESSVIQSIPVTTYIYVIEAIGASKVKIGISVDPEARLRQLSTGSPSSLRMLLFFAGSSEMECALHRRFHHARDQGEWFFLTKEIRDWIASKKPYTATRNMVRG